MKISLLFFGITRSLVWTIESIRENVIAPAHKQGEVSIFCHFFQQDFIINPRSGESGTAIVDEYRLLRPDWLALEPSGPCLAQWDFEKICSYGDAWDDDHASLRNLVHQLHSLHRVTEHALQQKPDLVIFCRPDLRYHDSLERSIRRAASSPRDLVLIPDWQWWEGLNDRFAVVRGEKAIRAYGQRILRVADYQARTGKPLHGEQLLKFALEEESIPYAPMLVRASRVRLGGVVRKENFTPQSAIDRRQRMEKLLRWFWRR